MTTIYQHPDGHSIDFTDNSLTVVSSDGIAVSIPMGLHGLVALGSNLEATFTEGDCAEQAGHVIASNCLDAILAGYSQADAVIQLTKALTALQALDHSRATAGFAVALVSVIEQGLDAAGKGD